MRARRAMREPLRRRTVDATASLSAAAKARESHASRTPRKRQFGRLHGSREACDLRASAAAN
eukprot:4530378-Lingulodinium_polyedra.AAC.1